jgi:hypothetical protein
MKETQKQINKIPTFKASKKPNINVGDKVTINGIYYECLSILDDSLCPTTKANLTHVEAVK